jgi:hypothetical protein
MKIKDLAGWAERDEESCTICDAHELANAQIDDSTALCCSNCKEPMEPDGIISLFTDVQTVSQDNGNDEEQEIVKRRVYICDKCHQSSALVLRPIIYNGNHDIHYTGEGAYIPVDHDDLDKAIRLAIEPNIEQFYNRIIDGNPQGLKPFNLITWLRYDIHKLISHAYDAIWQESKQ